MKSVDFFAARTLLLARTFPRAGRDPDYRASPATRRCASLDRSKNSSAVNFPSNSRPGIASVVTFTGRSGFTSAELLLRQGEIDKNLIKRLQRNQWVADFDHLTGIDGADSGGPIERRADLLFIDDRLHVFDRRLLLLVFGLAPHRIPRLRSLCGLPGRGRDRDQFWPAQHRPPPIAFGPFRRKRPASTRHRPSSPALPIENRFQHGSRQFRADHRALDRRNGTDGGQHRLPVGFLHSALVTVVGGGTIFFPAETRVTDLQDFDSGDEKKDANSAERSL